METERELNNAQLFSPEWNGICSKLRYYAKNHPDDFLHYLCLTWEKHGEEVINNFTLQAELKLMPVPTRCGQTPLSKSWIPKLELQFLCQRYMLEDEHFPFVRQSKQTILEHDTSFLSTYLGVESEENLRFYLQILVEIRLNDIHQQTVKLPRRILDLYLKIASMVGLDSNKDTACNFACDSFETLKLILVPTLPTSSWVSPKACVLKPAPAVLEKHCVLPPPTDWKASSEEEKALEIFYQNTLQIPIKASCFEVLEGLKSLAQKSDHGKTNTETSHILECYQYIDKEFPSVSAEDQAKLRSAFVDNPLIACPLNGEIEWRMTNNCSWAYGIEIPGYFDLSQHYAELGRFFVEILEVKELTIARIYHNLINPKSTDTPEEVKSMWLTLNDSIEDYGEFLDPEPFLKKAMFPVRERSNTIRLCPWNSDIYFDDHEPYQAHLKGKLEVFDFSPYEVWALGPLIGWAGLKWRCLSENVNRYTYLDPGLPLDCERRFTYETTLGILRLGRHFRSSRTTSPKARQSLCRKIQNATFFTSDKIRARLSILGTTMADQIDWCLHIEESENKLMIYLPHDQDERDMCTASELPLGITAWLMDKSPWKINADYRISALIKSVLEMDARLIEKFLDQEGVTRFEQPDSIFDSNEKRIIDQIEALQVEEAEEEL